MKIEIIYEDQDLMVCYKPAGLATQTSQITQKDMMSELKNHLTMQGQGSYVGLIHRLDQPVEGLLVFAKNKACAADLTRQVQSRLITKVYEAIVVGEVPAKGVLEDELIKEKQKNMSKVAVKGTKGAKKARLTYERLYTNGEISQVRIHLETGRHHQIRLQFASRGHAIIGDRKYGGVSLPPYDKLPLALCSTQLEFQHPKTLEEMKFSIQPQGEAFTKIEEMRKKDNGKR